MASQNAQSVVNGSAVVSAGLASATAALVTSRFGVAGTLIGAALTTMIITGGSAVLRSYLERVTGRVRKVPGKVREKAGRRRNSQVTDQQNIPSRPDLRNNFMGRLRAAFDWFFHLPPLRRRTILVGAIVPAVIAFLISMGAVTGLELAIGNSLPCGIWNNCPVASDGKPVTNTGPSVVGGRPAKTETPSQNQPAQNPQQQTPEQQTPSQQAPGQQTPEQQNSQPGADQNVQPDEGGDQNAQPGANPNAQPANPQQPATPEPAAPNSGTPDPGTPNSGAPDSGNPSDQAAPPAQGTPGQ